MKTKPSDLSWLLSGKPEKPPMQKTLTEAFSHGFYLLFMIGLTVAVGALWKLTGLFAVFELPEPSMRQILGVAIIWAWFQRPKD